MSAAEEPEAPFFSPAKGFNPKKFEGATLVLPIISVGNVPQLAVDLLITNLPELNLVGHLNSDDLIPFIGGPEEGVKGVVTALEIFGQKHGSNVYYIQQRSPVLKSRKDAFLQSLLEFIHSHKFQNLLILTSVDAPAEPTTDGSKHHKYSLQPNVVGFHTDFPSFSDIPTFTTSFASSTPPATAGVEDDSALVGIESKIPFLPGAGLTRRVLHQLSEDETKGIVRTGVILAFVVEGDNREDAKSMAELVKVTLNLGSIPEWKEPRSWEGMFGNGDGQRAEIFG